MDQKDTYTYTHRLVSLNGAAGELAGQTYIYIMFEEPLCGLLIASVHGPKVET